MEEVEKVEPRPVAEYKWKARAQAAEAQVEAMRKALEVVKYETSHYGQGHWIRSLHDRTCAVLATLSVPAEERGSSSASLPAHVAGATATEEPRFTGWRAFSVYGVEGEYGTIYLSANGAVAHTSDSSPMGRALMQLAEIQREARAEESEPRKEAPPGTPQQVWDLALVLAEAHGLKGYEWVGKRGWSFTVDWDALARAVLAAGYSKASSQLESSSKPESAADIIHKIASISAAVGWQSGEPAMEMAGLIVSVLHANPEHIERFMAEGGELILDGTVRAENGSLTYRAISGEMLSPAELRRRKGIADQ